jgi:transposase
MRYGICARIDSPFFARRIDPMRRAIAIQVSESERKTLEQWARGRKTPARLVLRAKIVLAAADGRENQEIAVACGTDPHTAARWRKRFAEKRLAGLEKDAPRSGRPADTQQSLAAEIVRMTTQEKPANATHWSTRTLAAELGTTHSMVHRVWKAMGLKPHRVKTFKISNDPRFAEKVVDVVGLYLDPPEHALVLCVDEKSQIQALDRTQKSLPMFPGRLGTTTHDYRRNGTTTLFAALNVFEGTVIGTCMDHHRYQDFIRFLKQVDAETPPELDLHLIVDNYATHKHDAVRKWLAKHKRFHLHFIPTSSSWLNLVERWFREITEKRIRRGAFRNVGELVKAITDYIAHNNDHAKPFVWTKTAEEILAKVARARKVLDNVPSE